MRKVVVASVHSFTYVRLFFLKRKGAEGQRMVHI